MLSMTSDITLIYFARFSDIYKEIRNMNAEIVLNERICSFNFWVASHVSKDINK